jgi:hypothetical protein
MSQEDYQMTKTEFACEILRIEAELTFCRADVLINNERDAIDNLLKARKRLGELCCNILNPDESRIYLAK